MKKNLTKKEVLAYFSNQNTNLLLIMLICMDITFIILHYINALTSLLNNPHFNISYDDGYPETFQYIKYVAVISLLILIMMKQRSLLYFPFVLLFIYFLLDDSIQIHEHFGNYFASNFQIKPLFDLRVEDIGELLMSICVALIILPSFIWTYIRGYKLFRRITMDLFFLILVFVFFGIFVDMADVSIMSIVPKNIFYRPISSILTLMEDGGEMISMSLIVWYVYFVIIQRENLIFSLIEMLYAIFIRPSYIKRL